MINIQDPHGQIENDERPEYPKKNKASAIPNFLPQMLVGNKIANDINSLNPNQNYILNVAHTLTKDYGKYNGHNVEPVHILISGSGDTCKSHW